jgi:Flp pilus assembly protein TadD
MTTTTNGKSIRSKLLPLGATGAVALALIAGGSFSEDVVAKPTPDKTAAAAQAALAKGQVDRAIELAESVVAGNPREPSYRALLAHAYLKAGRFDSAATTFDDALKLGDTSARTALGLSLSYIAAGRNSDAVAILDDWRDAIPTVDLGLALALAGEGTRGSAILADALRNGENTPKLRQNLAYSYALDGRWREARIMMSQDVPADQMDARLSEWAAKARPEDARLRIAGLLGAPLRSDPGQPVRLALNANPAAEQLAAESGALTAAAQVAAADPAQSAVELPVAGAAPVESQAQLASYAPVDAPKAGSNSFAAAFPGTEATTVGGVTYVSRPVIQSVPARQPRADAQRPARVAAAVARPVPARAATARVAVAADTHRIQLGSFFTEQGARRAWGIYTAKNPELRSYRMTITTAQVRGKTYYRVAAAGLDGNQGARSLCGTVKARGMACFAYATATGVPGTRATNAPAMAKAPASAPTKVAVAGPAMARKR